MKRAFLCFLACLMLLSCVMVNPQAVRAAENETTEIVSNEHPATNTPQESGSTITAMSGKPQGGTGTWTRRVPADMVPMDPADTTVQPLPAYTAKLSGSYVPTEQEAYQIMIALKAEFPEGMTYTNDNYYDWNGGIYYRGYGCAGFCFYLSDAVFGTAPSYIVEQFYYDQIRVGDILRVNDDTHSVTVMEKYSDYIVLAEANYGGKVHWGRVMTYDEVMSTTTYLMSRYPKDGWYIFDDYYYYYKNDVPVTGWASDEYGDQYYFDEQGRMTVGWLYLDGEWYYFDEYGIMWLGFLYLNGNWYAFNDSGHMITGWASDSNGDYYYFDENGIMQTGWLLTEDGWCYLDETGVMATYWQLVDGKYYYFGSDGIMVTDWQMIDGSWYYFNNAMVTGWQQIDGEWYYFGSNGAMRTGWQQIGGKWYYLNSSMATGWTKVSGKWYYMNSSGVMQTGWIKLSGKWYYLNNSMATGWTKISNKWYYMNSSGVMQTGWLKVSNKWYYMNSSGVMQTGWLQLGSKWYYLNSSGAMLTGTHVINGKTYTFNSSGVWIP